jgi:peptide/nickel transport system permease protein
MKLQTYRKTKFSLAVLLALLIASIFYDYFGPEDYRSMLDQLYDENGNVLKNPPYPPSKDYILGTDRDGRDNLLLILDGLKYTIAAVFIVSLARVTVGATLGLITETWTPAIKAFVKAFFLPFHYVPLLLVAIILMDAVIFPVNEIPVTVKIEYQLIVLFLLGFPAVFFFTTDLVKEISTKSYVTSSALLGGSKFHILRVQILPHLKPHLILLFVQQVLQTLQILIGLALFRLFLGGRHEEEIYNTPYPKSITNELAGLTGQNFWTLKNAPWVAFSSLGLLLIIFILVIVIKNEIIANMERHTEQSGISFPKNKQQDIKADDDNITPANFIPIKQKVLDR